MIRILNIVGLLLVISGGLFLAPVFEHNLGVSRFWALPVMAVGGVLLLVRHFMREKMGEEA